MESIRKRTNVLGIFLIVISAAVLFHSIILNTKHIGYDFEFYHFPLFAFIAEQFRIGEFPLLDRFVYSGQDYLSNSQSMLFYPIQFAYLWVRGFLRRAPTLFEYQLFYLAHYLWAAIGTYCLSRKLGGSQLISFATSAILWFGGESLGDFQHLAQNITRCWFPWFVLASYYLHIERRILAAVPMALAVWLAVTAGFPPDTIAFITVSGALGIVLTFVSIDRPSGRFRALLIHQSSILLGILLATPSWLPIAIAAQDPLAVNFKGFTPLIRLASYVTPNILHVFEPAQFLGEGSFTTHYLFMGPLLFVCIGALLIDPRTAYGHPLLGFAFFIFSYSVSIGVIESFVSLPAALMVIRPETFSFYGIALITCALPACRRLAAATAVGAMIYLLAWGASGLFLAGVRFNIKDWLVWGTICTGTLSLAALVARVRIFRRLPANEIALASIALLVLVFHAVKPQAIWFHALPTNSYGATWVDWSREIDLQQLRKATEPYRIAVNQKFLGGPFNAAWRVWRIESINGFEPTLSEHYAKFIYPNLAKSRTNRTFGDFDLQSEVWSELNVLYYMTNVNEPRVDAPGWTIVYENFYRIYRNDRFVPRFRLVDQTCDRSGAINIRSQKTNGWRIDVTDACPGTQLLASENPDLSWGVMVNGKSLPWTRPGERFGLLVDLEQGANSVEIEYLAPLLFPSFVIQFIGFIALVSFAIVAWSTARPKVEATLS